MTNRKRDKTLTVRLTSAEKDMIATRASKAKMTLTDFLVAVSLQTPIHIAENVKPVLVELKRIGNNVNQITTKANSGAVYANGLQEVADALHGIYEQVYRIARRD